MSIPYLQCLHFNVFNARQIPTRIADSYRRADLPRLRQLFHDSASFSARKTTGVNLEEKAKTPVASSSPLRASSERLLQTIKNWVSQRVSSVRAYFSNLFHIGELGKKTETVASAGWGENLRGPLSAEASSAIHEAGEAQSLKSFAVADAPEPLNIVKEPKPAETSLSNLSKPAENPAVSEQDRQNMAFWRSMFSAQDLQRNPFEDLCDYIDAELKFPDSANNSLNDGRNLLNDLLFDLSKSSKGRA